MLFGKTKKISDVDNQSIRVLSIPPDFYGGKNPEVRFKSVIQEVGSGENLKAPVVYVEPLVKEAAGASALSSKKFLIIGSVVLFVVFIAGASWYYWQQAVSTVAPKPSEPVVSLPVSLPAATATEPAAASLPPPELPVAPVVPEVPLSLQDAAITFPSALLGDSVDPDQDGLTDPEEEMYRSDPTVPDTDQDKYLDGQEIINLYSPVTGGAAKLIDSDLVKNYSNPVFGYQVYYPTNWAVGNVDPDYRDVLFSTFTGENVEIRVFDKISGEDFAGWFAKWAPQENYGDLIKFNGIFKVSGKERQDHLVYYLEDAGHWYVFLYHTTDSFVANYRATIRMMADSFRAAKSTDLIIPPRLIEEAATTTP